MTKPTIVLGFVGSTFDQGYKEDRWLRWRPTVSLCMHEDLHIDELHLLYNPRDKRLVKQVTEDIAQCLAAD